MLLDYTQMTELKAELEKCQKTIQKILNSDIFYDEAENDNDNANVNKMETKEDDQIEITLYIN